MNSATISADIISYTSLSNESKRFVERKIRELLEVIDDVFKTEKILGRIVHGDSIEFGMQSPVHALRIALLLKTYLKALDLPGDDLANKRLKYFKEHGVRIALAVAPLTLLDPENGIIDGEAIYLSGRAIKGQSTSDKQKIIIKSTMYFCSLQPEEHEKYETIFSLLDTIISRCSGKQCEVVFFKLLGLSEKEICGKLGKYQSTISQHSTAAGWQSIEKSVNYFEKHIN